MSRVSWKDMKTNEKVLEESGVKEKLLVKMVKTRKIGYYGHVRRHATLQKEILEGRVDGKRAMGKRRTVWTMKV